MFYNQRHLKKGINGLMSDKRDRMEDRMLRTGCYCVITIACFNVAARHP
ncbi:hypothetical protein CI610_03527 [invertebrate metagenome]|uniref:Uncharacterized protein n=1 Tax=invertebrate metagenome TaxID=1711999 RepID=A0A2H9T2X9_9ZZZZ